MHCRIIPDTLQAVAEIDVLHRRRDLTRCVDPCAPRAFEPLLKSNTQLVTRRYRKLCV